MESVGFQERMTRPHRLAWSMLHARARQLSPLYVCHHCHHTHTTKTERQRQVRQRADSARGGQTREDFQVTESDPTGGLQKHSKKAA
jgi:hypothetical protein